MNELFKQAGVLETQLVTAFAKAPHLPKEWRAMLVSFAPWITLIGGVVAVLAALSLVSVLLSPIGRLAGMYSGGWSVWVILTIAIEAIVAYLYFMAFPALKEKKKAGWDKIYFAQLVTVAYAVISLFSNGSSFVGTIIGIVIGLYLLFEVRDEYK